MPGSPAEKVLIVPFAANQLIASKPQDSGYQYYELDLPEIAQLGPYIESITAHTDTRVPSTNALWTVAFQWSYDAKTYNPTTPIELFTANGTAGQAIRTPYTTTGNFGLNLKFMLAIKPSTGTALETVSVSGSFVIVLRS